MRLFIDLLGIPGAREILTDDDEIGVFIPYEPNILVSEKYKRTKAWLMLSVIKEKYKSNQDVIGRLRMNIPTEYKEKYFLSDARAKARSIGVAMTEIQPYKHTTEEKQAIFDDIVGDL